MTFIHERIGTAAIAEQYIEGRGFTSASSATTGCACCRSGNCGFETWRRATGRSPPKKAKHDPDYQERRGILHGAAPDLAPEIRARIERSAKRIFRTLELDGYARIDFRLSNEGVPYFLEANPNPEIAESQEFASAALHDGLAYPDLLQGICGIRSATGADRAYGLTPGALLRMRTMKPS